MNSNPNPISELDLTKLPVHVAIIMDGNGRWAKQRWYNRIKGHEKGADVVREIVRTSREIGIQILTLYAFSTENWQRPESEVSALMTLLKKFLKSEEKEMMDNNIRLNAIGRIEDLPADVRQTLLETMQTTANNSGMILNLALSYGGRAEILQMVKNISTKVKNGIIDVDSITEQTIADHLYTRDMADPDLMIRTSGEMRISNFLLWQLAYSELFITETLWPDFTREEYLQILKSYQSRDRRFGKIAPE